MIKPPYSHHDVIAVRSALVAVLGRSDIDQELAWAMNGFYRRNRRINWQRTVPSLMAVLSERQAHRCCWCARPMSDPSFEHYIPLSRGGSDHPDNLVIACKLCNAGRDPYATSSTGLDGLQLYAQAGTLGFTFVGETIA